MRRLLILLLLIAGFGGIAPAAPVHHGATPTHHAQPSGGCHDDGLASHHVCFGCAVAPDDDASPIAGRAPAALAYRALLPSRPLGHRIGFDPPPPRAAG